MPRVGASHFSESTWALLVGVGATRETTLSPLPRASAEIADLGAALGNPEGCGVPPPQICQISDASPAETATKTHFLRTLRELCAKVPADGFLFVWFSGHGVRAESGLYLCTSDTLLADIETTAVSSQLLSEKLARCQARRILLVLDCCRSAGFAEQAPDFFTSPSSRDFTILLCASRSDEPSWELLDGHGTLFSRHILNALRGEEIPGNISGSIFFADLLEHLNVSIAEDLDRWHPGVPPQQPIFAGTFGRDPLLFLHRRLTLEGLAIRTARYSPAYVRSMLRRTVAGITLAGLLALGLLWVLLENSQFARPDGGGGSINISDGLPDIHAFGYPVLNWSMPIGPDLFPAQHPMRTRGSVRSPIGTPLLPALIADMNETGRGLVAYWRGEDTKAADLLRPLVQGLPEPTSGGLELKIFSAVSNETDFSTLARHIGHPDAEVRRVLMKNLMRISIPKTLELLYQPWVKGRSDIIVAALTAMEPPCGPDKFAYIRNIGLGYSVSERERIVDAQWRAGCVTAHPKWNNAIKPEDIVAMAYGGWSALGDRFAEELTKAIDVPRWKAAKRAPTPKPGQALIVSGQDGMAHTAIQIFSKLPVVPCLSAGETIIEKITTFERWYLGLALARACPGFHLKVEKTNDADVAYRAQLVGPGPKTWIIGELKRYNMKTGEPFRLVDIAPAIPRDRGIEIVRDVLDTTEDPSAVLPALAFLQAASTEPAHWSSLLRSQSEEVRIAAWLLRCLVKPRSAIEDALARLQDEEFKEALLVLAFAPLTTSDLAAVRASRRQPGVEGERALAAIAAHGQAQEVADLLAAPDWATRRTVLAFVGANPNLIEIATLIKNARFPPDPVTRRLQDLVQDRSLAEADIERLPEIARAWRARLLAYIHKSGIGADGHYVWLKRRESHLIMHN